jgi:hypothetical protein
MKKSINANQKRRGRPATGTAPMVGVRMTPEFQNPIKAWAKSQQDRPTMAEAIRRLVELGLTVKATKAKQVPASRAHRAKELASQAIDNMGDPTAHPEERAQRRRTLTKGPEEFREARVDRPKAKGK